MAARRLIAVLLVLLFLSSLAAALAPVEERGDETSTSTTTPLPDEPPASEGRLIARALDAAAKRPATIRAGVGDQLQLRVTARRTATIELVGLGESEDVDPLAPARFDVLLDTRGRFTVRVLESGREVGTIVVSRRPAPREPAPAEAGARS